jgi:hypothetical protein
VKAPQRDQAAEGRVEEVVAGAAMALRVAE